jgi:hypothetical protein
VDARDAADTIQEAAEAGRSADERFRRRAALAIGVLAMLLAIAGLGGENATKEMVNANISASDSWAFYQAKSVRQTSLRFAAEELELLLPTLPPDQRSEARQRIDGDRTTVARYESEPDPDDPANHLKGEGKNELLARARYWEARRDRAQRQDPNFDYAQALFQIAIVLGSVSIVAVSRRLLALASGLGVVATVLMLNGFLLVVDLPIG